MELFFLFSILLGGCQDVPSLGQVVVVTSDSGVKLVPVTPNSTALDALAKTGTKSYHGKTVKLYRRQERWSRAYSVDMQAIAARADVFTNFRLEKNDIIDIRRASKE